MAKSKKNLEFTFERTIPALPEEVYDAWLNPEVKGNHWNVAKKLLFNPKVDGLYYIGVEGFPHYGRFTKLKRPSIIEHTWVSPNTMGLETNVTVTFKKQGAGALMTLVHRDLPNTEEAKGHEEGSNYFLDIFPGQFKASRKK
ncbi:MAG: SRPBCC domain-containing protein [Bdellovibrio sp.]|nr:MAG: SRPBCC domain-containing protein [Bdellovibrio sp.]